MTVYFVGAGPGAADLITVRGARIIASSPVCLYAGSLVPRELLATCPAEARVIDSSRMTLDAIVAEMVDATARGEDVARVHSGDPSLYSAVAEQARRLDAAGVDYEIVPGVPSFAAASAALKRELTVPEVSQTVVLTRISTLSTAMPDGEDLATLARSRATMVIHLGARTDTTEQSVEIFNELNLEYSRALWMLCAGFDIPFLYASSAATYGLGEFGYSDDPATIPQLRPLNPYGQSKQDFDLWVLEQTINDKKETITHDRSSFIVHRSSFPWAGFKFFNVYGPNEYHKGRMASVIFHTARQIKSTGEMNLFRSHRPDFQDGAQSRDFIYVKDVVDVLLYFLEKKPGNAIYNLGTGQARTFLDLANGTFQAMDLEPKISYIDTPADIRDTYQYFTQAEMSKLRAAGYLEPFIGLEEGIQDYVLRYLKDERLW